jgi:hypothetical protein
VLRPENTGRRDCIQFWSAMYSDPNEEYYTKNISKPFTPAKIRKLFYWKNGGELSQKKLRSIENNFITRLNELTALPENTSAEDFLEKFQNGGAIWRIFWLHCWQPMKFPIYDMHVHRAMTYIENGTKEELGSFNDNIKIQFYLERYLPFTNKFDDCSMRNIDRALYTFGKFIKGWSIEKMYI